MSRYGEPVDLDDRSDVKRSRVSEVDEPMIEEKYPEAQLDSDPLLALVSQYPVLSDSVIQANRYKWVTVLRAILQGIAQGYPIESLSKSVLVLGQVINQAYARNSRMRRLSSMLRVRCRVLGAELAQCRKRKRTMYRKRGTKRTISRSRYFKKRPVYRRRSYYK